MTRRIQLGDELKKYIKKKMISERLPKSWYFAIYRGPKEEDEHYLASVELPGGEDDVGLMETDLTVLASILKEHAHPDLTQKEIEEAVLSGLRDDVTILGHCISVKKR